jgi:hypothetical protein
MATKKKNVKRAEPTIPETLNTPEFTAAWAEWLQFTQERGMPLADDDAVRQLKLLAKLGAEKAIADIRKTMEEHPLKDRVPDQAEVAKKGKSSKKAETAEDTRKKAPAKAGKEKKAKAPKEPKEKKMSALDAAAKVLEENGEPMTCPEMIEAMSSKGYWSSPGGQTPSATLYSAILRETSKKGSDARFKKAARGKFVRA